MEIMNIALQEVSIPSYTPAESFNSKLMHEPSNKTDFDAVMETLEHTAMVAEQPAQTEADDCSLLFCSEPKTIAEPSVKESLDDSEVLLCEEPKGAQKQEEGSELLTGTVENLEAEPNKKRAKEDTLQLENPFAVNKYTQSSVDFEPKKEDQTANEQVRNSPSCSPMHDEQGITLVKAPENKQSLQTMFIIDAEHKYESCSYYKQFEDLVLPNSEIAEFVQNSNLELHIEPEPITFKQDVALQSEKLVHNVWREADLVQQLKENGVHSLRAEQLRVLDSEANESDINLFKHKDLDFKPELVTVTKQADITTYEQEAAEQDENGLDLTSLDEDFKPYATAQNIQELSQIKDGYYDTKNVKVITKQIAFNIEKAIAGIENSQPVKIQMSLTPKELGTLVINFVVEEGKIAMLTIAASNQHTRELISKNMVMLQQELDKSGFEVKTVEIFGTGASNSGSSTESGQHENQERQQEAYEHLLQKDFKHEFAVNFGKRGEIA